MITGKPLINGSPAGVNSDLQQPSQGEHRIPTPQPQTQLSGHPDAPALLSLGREQQYAAIQLSHYVYTLLCIISQLMTTNGRLVMPTNGLCKVYNCIAFSLQAHMSNTKGGDKQYRHNQQLEELRNLQDKLSGEKASWAATKEQEEKELEEKRQELLRLQVSNLTLLKLSTLGQKNIILMSVGKKCLTLK